MNKNWKYIFEPGACPTIDELKLYSANKLGKERRFAIENHLADCEICTDLLEGFEALSGPERLKSAESDLKDRVDTLLGSRKKLRLLIARPWVVAASIVLLLGSAILIFLLNRYTPDNSQLELAKQTEVTKPAVLLQSTDSIKVLAEEKEISVSKSVKQREQTKIITDSRIYELEAAEEGFEMRSESVVAVAEPKPENRTDTERSFDDAISAQSDQKAKSDKTLIYSSNSSDANLIRGKITDDSGQPLPGVSIQIKGTTQGTISDLNGNYTIEVPDSDAELVFNYVGYLSENRSVQNNKNLEVKLKEDIVALDEVVVVGYGTMKKSAVTGSVSKVSNEELKKTDANQVERAIQGKVAGVTLSKKAEKGEFVLDPSENARLIDSLLAELKKYPDNLRLNQELAQKYLESGDKENAIDQLQILFRDVMPDETREQLIEIIQLTQDGDYPKAIRKLKKIEFQ